MINILLLTAICLLFGRVKGYNDSSSVKDIIDIDENIISPLFIDINDHADIFHQICNKLNVSETDCDCTYFPQLCIFENVSTNHTFKRSDVITMIYAAVSSAGACLSLLANSVVLVTAFLNRTKLSPCKIHIAQLAAINLLFSVLQIINTGPLFWTNEWIYGLFMCKCVRTLLETGTFLSVGYIQIIALERFFLVHSPLFIEEFNQRFKNLLVCINIALVIFSVIPYTTVLTIEDYTNRCIAVHDGNEDLFHFYNFLVVCLYSILPIISLLLLSAKMINQLRRKDKDILANLQTTRVIERNRRIMYITMIIFLFFIICTLPTRAITIYMDIIGSKSGNVSKYVTLTLISYFTYPLQNTLNPILFSLTAKTWRRQVKSSLAGLTVTLNTFKGTSV